MNETSKKYAQPSIQNDRKAKLKSTLLEVGKIAGRAFVSGVFFGIGQHCYGAAAGKINGNRDNVIPFKKVG